MEPLQTVYLGGGTPSLLPPELLKHLLKGLRSLYDFGSITEFSAEVNPGTLTRKWMDAATSLGVNRISMGAQSFQPAILQTLGRIHTVEQIRSSVSLIRAAGIRNLSLDLMFGIPGQTLSDWHETLECALELEPEHLSVYGLILEENTLLKREVDAGCLVLPEPELERDMYDLAIRTLASRGFEQYEISNFARAGFACQHNIGYWQQIPYLGLGLSAASMFPLDRLSSSARDSLHLPDAPSEPGFPCLRQTNPAALSDYESMIRRPSSGIAAPQRVTERISAREARFETLMLGLRMNSGVSEKRFETLHRVSMVNIYGEKLRMLQDNGLLIHQDGSWRLTRRGMDIQNSVLVELMEECSKEDGIS